MFQGGGRIISTSAEPSPTVVAQGQPTSGPAIENALVALAPTEVAPSSPPVQPQPETQGEPAPTEEEITMQALSLPVDPQAAALEKIEKEGIVAVRSATSNRGGSRALQPAPTPEPAAEPTPEPEEEQGPLEVRSYTVVEGDTLLALAESFGITPETILWANDLGNGELLQIGQELSILPVSGVLHTVSAGETFNEIAEAYGADAEELIRANALADADSLAEGQVLIVPGGMLMTDPIEGLPDRPSEEELAAAPRYTVEEGDTLLSIADAFGVRPSVIQVANELLDPDMLRVGDELVIPGGEAGAPAPQPAPAPAEPAPAPKPAPKPAPAPAIEPAPAAEPASEPAPAESSSEGERIAAIAQAYLGYRYLWGGHSPATGFDCSGYTWYVYKEAGYNIPLHDLAGQLNAGPRIGRDGLLPGDLVFFQNTYKPGLSHSGLYLGGGRFINAETERTGVQIRSLSDPYWAPRYIGASRPWAGR